MPAAFFERKDGALLPVFTSMLFACARATLSSWRVRCPNQAGEIMYVLSFSLFAHLDAEGGAANGHGSHGAHSARELKK